MSNIAEKTHAFIFEGVGLECQGYVHLLNSECKEQLKRYCSIVYKEIGMDLWSYLHELPYTNYGKVFHDWISIYTIDYIVYHNYTDAGIKPGVFLGYSMGLITALACGKAISFEDGLKMLLCIYGYLEKSAEQQAMGVIVGMTCEDVEKVIMNSNLGESVAIASENNENCILISGIKSSVEKVMSLSASEGALKVKAINTPFACHSKYAEKGMEVYMDFIERLQVSDSTVPVISSYDQEIIQDSGAIKKELGKNTIGRMYWKASIEKAFDMGFSSFFEVSLDDSISKFSKLINTDCEFISYKKFINLRLKGEQNGGLI
ncbi:MAG: ACP S-malonyltransferase [Clostridia bacterium]|nr:ACP S-malonyltransferase [Clostridia bacterium]